MVPGFVMDANLAGKSKQAGSLGPLTDCGHLLEFLLVRAKKNEVRSPMEHN